LPIRASLNCRLYIYTLYEYYIAVLSIATPAVQSVYYSTKHCPIMYYSTKVPQLPNYIVQISN